MKILVDTSVLIDYLRTAKSSSETKLSQIYQRADGLVFSLISVGEIFSGTSVPEKIEDIRKLFKLGEMIGLNYALMVRAGEIRRTTKISLLDAIIASSALTLDLPVATLNVKDFSKVKGLKLL